MRVRTGLMAAMAIAIALVGDASAANKKDIARAKNVRQFGQCVRCDLSGADLRDGFFQLANMIEANLSGAKFDGANMAGVQFYKANLSGGSFVYTNLSGAQFSDADLRNADFTHAWLNWAWFGGSLVFPSPQAYCSWLSLRPIALERSAPCNCAPIITALVKLAPSSLAPPNQAQLSQACVKSALRRSASEN